MNHLLSTLLLASVLLVSCGGEQKSNDEAVPEETEQQAMETSIAPGTSRITGTIISISNSRAANEQTPCGKAPCLAVVRVDSVHGYGSGFGKPLPNGSQHPMRFTFTLAPTTPDLFPNMDATYPGLEVGSSFTSNITPVSGMASESDDAAYTVDSYTRIQ